MSTPQHPAPTPPPVSGDAATVTPVAEQIRTLHDETVAAVEQRQVLAAQARVALIAALNRGVICRPGCEDALDTWGLEPLPQRWSVSADTHVAYTRPYTHEDEAREQAHWYVIEELRGLLPTTAVYVRQVVDVTPADGPGDDSGSRLYHVIVLVTFRTWITATREGTALTMAQATLEAHRPALTDAGFTVPALIWQVDTDPDDAPLDTITTDAAAGPVRLPEIGDDLTAVTGARNRAVWGLADLRRRIRARAIRALADDEFSRDFSSMAQRVNQFLVDLGLAGLPRAHHVMVEVNVTMRVDAATAAEAHNAMHTAMRATFSSTPDEERPWTAYGWIGQQGISPDGNRWQVPWRHEYEMWLRGHTTADTVTAAADRFARDDVAQALAGVDHTVVAVTVTVEDVGFDPNLDPDRD